MEVQAPQLADFARYRVEPGEGVALADHDPGDTDGLAGPDEIEREYADVGERIADLQERLYAELRLGLRRLLVGRQPLDQPRPGEPGRERRQEAGGDQRAAAHLRAPAISALRRAGRMPICSKPWPVASGRRRGAHSNQVS